MKLEIILDALVDVTYLGLYPHMELGTHKIVAIFPKTLLLQSTLSPEITPIWIPNPLNVPCVYQLLANGSSVYITNELFPPHESTYKLIFPKSE